MPRLRCVLLVGDAAHAASTWRASAAGAGRDLRQPLRLDRDPARRRLLTCRAPRRPAGASSAARCCRWAAASRTCSCWCSTAPGGWPASARSGEIYVRSPHLARGYLGDAGADRRALPRRIRSPATPGGDRIYRTGDLGRYLPDGERRVRRPRRPPGEDPRLPHRAGRDRGGAGAPCPACARRVVVVREERPGDARLVAYVVPEPERRRPAAELRAVPRARACPTTWCRPPS